MQHNILRGTVRPLAEIRGHWIKIKTCLSLQRYVYKPVITFTLN